MGSKSRSSRDHGHEPDKDRFHDHNRDHDSIQDHDDGHGHDHHHVDDRAHSHDSDNGDDHGDGDNHGDGDEHDHSRDHGHGHDHSHGHDHGRDHGHRHSDRVIEVDASAEAATQNSSPRSAANTAERKAYGRKLRRATAFVLFFFVVEMVGGIWSGSLAVMSDAAHLLSDVSGFVLAIVANEIAGQPASASLTYGPVRAEVLSALFSTVFLLVLSFLLVYSAFFRIYDMWKGEAEQIDGRLMSMIALVGLLVNLTLLGIFGHDDDLGQNHNHGHGHGHRHGNHGNTRCLNNPDEEQGLGANRSSVRGGSERSTLYHVKISYNTHTHTHTHTWGAQGTLSLSKNCTSRESVSPLSRLIRGFRNNDGSVPSLTGAYGSTAERTAGESIQQNDSNERERKRNINMEAAMLHALTDLVQSLGVLLAGLLIWYDPRWQWADPISTLLFVCLVVNQTRWLLARAFNVLLEGVPETINYERLRNRLANIPGVTDLHCLHVWSLTMGKAVVSVHIKATDPEKALSEAHKVCEDMGVEHSTIQVQMDCCAPSPCTHPCVSNVSACCEIDANGVYAHGQPTPPPTESARAAS
ncbi:unnamed protein product [Ascophyllum nodosum]